MGTLPFSGQLLSAPADAPRTYGLSGPLVIMPTFREAANVGQALERVRRSVQTSTVLVVDDDGGDGTADLAEQAGRELGQVEVLRRAAKAGLANAYSSGFAWGLERGYKVLVGMDADLSHDATALPRLLAALNGGADVAVGSRYIPGGSTVNWPVGRRVLSQWGNWYARRCLQSGITDLTSAFRAYRADALERVDFSALRSEGYGFLIELAHVLERMGAVFTEVPVHFVNRSEGRSKLSTRIAIESFRVVTNLAWRERRGRQP